MLKTKIRSVVLGSVLGALVFVSASVSEHKILFEKARFMMETEGDLRGAIALFERIISRFPAEREYAARSQLFIGLCYEKLGMTEAQKAFDNVLSNYPEQTESVQAAREKLSVLRQTIATPTEMPGIRLRQVWSGKEVDSSGSISPNGRLLSFVDWKTGDLAIRDLQTGVSTRLTNVGSIDEARSEFAGGSVWSADGSHLAYRWFNGEYWEARVIDLNSKTSRILFADKRQEIGEVSGWIRDGNRILASVFSRYNTQRNLVLITAYDGSLRVIRTGDVHIVTADISRDGKWVAYEMQGPEGSNNSDIFLLSTDDGREQSLIQDPSHESLLGFTPDGKHVLFASDRSGSLDAWMIPISPAGAAGAPQLLKSNIGRARSMGMTADGSLFYSVSSDAVDVDRRQDL